METLSNLKAYFDHELNHYEEGEQRAIYGIVLEYFDIDKIKAMVDPDFGVENSLAEEFKQIVQRLKKDEPIQYILKEAPFCGLNFYVDDRVLVPRPETEELVHWILEEHGKQFAGSLLDIGTGSGCIALALDHLMPAAKVSATEVSEGAFEVAKKNATQLKSRADIKLDDIRVWQENDYPNFDIIISNPPYIDLKEKESLYKNVLDFEPHVALFAPEGDTLYFYKLIADFANRYLNENGVLYFEMSEFYAGGVEELLIAKGFRNVELKNDLSGKGRMMRATRSVA